MTLGLQVPVWQQPTLDLSNLTDFVECTCFHKLFSILVWQLTWYCSTMVEPIFDYQFRLILIGDSTVGKSSLLKYFTDGKFAEVCDPTVGVDFFARLIEVKQGVRVKLQLWDTAGQERFRWVLPIKRAHGATQMKNPGIILMYESCHQCDCCRISLIGESLSLTLALNSVMPFSSSSSSSHLLASSADQNAC